MKLIDIEQNTPAWMDFRKSRIGGSSLSAIWSTRNYTVKDVKEFLIGRGVDLVKYKAELDEKRGNKKPLVKADFEALLTDDDKDQLSVDSDKQAGYYRILAGSLMRKSEPEEEYENERDRGHELEDAACDKASMALNKTSMAVGCIVDDEDDRIYNSPDRIIVPKKYAGKYEKVLEDVNSGKLKIKEEIEAKCLEGGLHLWSFFEQRVPEKYFTQKVQYFISNKDLQTLYFAFYHPLITMLPLFVIVVKRKDLGHWPETLEKYQRRTLKELDGLKEELFDRADNIIIREKVK